MSSTFQWDCSVAARPPEGAVSWPLSLLALPRPRRLRAGGGQQAQARLPSLVLGLPLPCPVLKDTATGDSALPTAPSHPGQAPPPPRPSCSCLRHVDFASGRQSLDGILRAFLLGTPNLLPRAQVPSAESGNPAPGPQQGAQLLEAAPPEPGGPPLSHPRAAFLWQCCVFL